MRLKFYRKDAQLPPATLFVPQPFMAPRSKKIEILVREFFVFQEKIYRLE